MSQKLTLTDRVMALFMANPGRWLDGHLIAREGGYAAWRSRISEARARGLDIRNRQRIVKTDGGTRLFKVTEYRYTPPADLLEIAERPAQEATW
jgi:hypothetical protein